MPHARTPAASEPWRSNAATTRTGLSTCRSCGAVRARFRRGFGEWVRQNVGDVFVQMFDTALAHWLGTGQTGMYAFTPGPAVPPSTSSSTAASSRATTTSRRTTSWARSGVTAHCSSWPPCRSSRRSAGTRSAQCDVRFVCNGGCPKRRFLTTPEGEPGLQYLCAGCQRFLRGPDRTGKSASVGSAVRLGPAASGSSTSWAARGV